MAVINVKSENDLSGLYILYRGAVNNERKGNLGISHLMEHLICHQLDDLLDDFDRDGISWNAYTSNNEICFYFTGLDEYLSKYKDVILTNLLTFKITEAQFKNELKIVLEEYKDCFNKQSENHGLNLGRILFNDYDAIGLREDLETLVYQDVKDFFELQYSKPHKIINVSKDGDLKTDIEFSKETFENVGEFFEPTGSYQTIDDEKFWVRENGDKVPIESYSSFNGKSSIIDVSGVITEDFPTIDFITSMLGSGLKSPLYQEIREKRGLVYYVRCGFNRLTNKSGVITISSETSTENVEEFQTQVSNILSNPAKYMTQERFDIVKQAMEIKLKKNEIYKHSNVGKYITPKEWQIEPILKGLTLEKVMKVYDKYFHIENFIKSVDTE